MSLISLNACFEAYNKIRNFFPATPLTYSNLLSEEFKREIYIKWDNKLRTGAFKERGAINFLTQLSSSQIKKGVIAASAGNHALAVSHYARALNIPCTIVMPKTAPVVKVRKVKENRADVVLFGSSFHESMEYAKKYSHKENKILVHAFDDEKIIIGQSTCGIEIFEDYAEPDAIIVPIGGGGLISGISFVTHALKKKTKIIGVRSQWAVDARSGKFATLSTPLTPASIADGIAVKTVGEITEKMIKKYVHTTFNASEESLAASVLRFLEVEKSMVEGAGAASLVPLLDKKLPKALKKIVLVVCGSNIDVNMLSRLIARELGETGRIIRIRVSVPDRPGSLALISKILAEAGAQIIQTNHDRALCKVPGNTLISFMVELRDRAHHQEVIRSLKNSGVDVHQTI